MEGGGTDAGRISMVHRGVPSLCIGVPTRYIHSHTGVINIQDYYKAIELTSAIVAKLDEETVASIKKVW
jgi:putative aminopeptidase FrvX